MTYICECCGEEKEDWPAIAYNSPSQYMDLSDEEEKNSDLHFINRIPILPTNSSAQMHGHAESSGFPVTQTIKLCL